MKPNKIDSLLGLAMRGHNLVSGEFQTMEAIKKGTARLVIVSTDASDNTAKRFKDKSRYYEVPCLVWGTKESLGRAIGKELRSSLCVCDEGLAKAVIGLIAEQQKEWKETVEINNGKSGGKNGEN